MATELDTEKAIEILLYIAPRMGNNLYNSLKIIYLADKGHLAETGSFMYGETYSALDYGPVPSFAYDVAKVGTGRACAEEGRITQIPNFEGSFDLASGARDKLVPVRKASLDYLSRSDISAIETALEAHGNLDFGGLKKLSHDDAYHATSRNRNMSKQAIAATTGVGPELVQHLEAEHLDNYTER